MRRRDARRRGRRETVRSRDPGTALRPRCRPRARRASTSNLSLVVSQSPIAGWNPSSIWKTSNGHEPASARLAARSRSVTSLEVVVPGAPTDLVRRGDTRTVRGADGRRPPIEWTADVVVDLPRLDRVERTDGGSLAPRRRRSTPRPTAPALGHAVAAGRCRRARCRRGSRSRAAGRPTRRRAPSPARCAARRVPRWSGSAWCMSTTSGIAPGAARRVLVDTEGRPPAR